MKIEASKKKIGILGGTFNPIHFGHLRLAEEVREKLNLSRIIFIPSCIPPLKKSDVVSADHRLEMVRMAIESNPFFELSDIECKRQGISYTLHTLKELRQIWHGTELVFIMGIDSFLELPLWYKPEEIVELTDFAIMNRPPHSITEIYGSPYLKTTEMDDSDGIITLELVSGRKVFLLEVQGLDISASRIRQKVRNGESIKYLLPESVELYIISKGLYKRAD
ncbi:MAG: nicotinate-nucleotide adenylyltransferase [Nitrospirae bacterium]|nr:nicotinate-nucleotide adenylyltransferase [Nitrospirota bacterium]